MTRLHTVPNSVIFFGGGGSADKIFSLFNLVFSLCAFVNYNMLTIYLSRN